MTIVLNLKKGLRGKVAVGFEPTNRGFAIRSLRPLGHATDELLNLN